MSEITLHIEYNKAIADLRKTVLKRTDLKPALKEFGIYMVQRTKETFRNLGRGGTFRGVTWKPFADQYRRMDGTTIPAEGGIKKSRGAGKVKGRLRPSGKRVTASSRLLQDTGQLRSSVASRSAMKVDRNGLHFTTAKEYGKYQQADRPVLFFETPKDINELRSIIMRRNSGK